MALSDVAYILGDLAQEAGSAVALKYDLLLEKHFDRLAAHPRSGAPRRRLGAGIRIGVVSPYVVVYRYSLANDTVTVLRVVHGRRRLMRAMIPGAAG